MLSGSGSCSSGTRQPGVLHRVVLVVVVGDVGATGRVEGQRDVPAVGARGQDFGDPPAASVVDRKPLYKKIDERVDVMIRKGLVDEVRGIIARYKEEDAPGLSGIGYRQVIGYLKGSYGHEEMVRLIKRDTRRYAKRQYTWWRKEKDICWLDMDSMTPEAALRLILSALKHKKRN